MPRIAHISWVSVMFRKCRHLLQLLSTINRHSIVLLRFFLTSVVVYFLCARSYQKIKRFFTRVSSSLAIVIFRQQHFLASNEKTKKNVQKFWFVIISKRKNINRKRKSRWNIRLAANDNGTCCYFWDVRIKRNSRWKTVVHEKHSCHKNKLHSLWPFWCIGRQRRKKKNEKWQIINCFRWQKQEKNRSVWMTACMCISVCVSVRECRRE